MGALVLTKGTRRLIAYFNREFGSSAAHGNIDYYRDKNNIKYFDQGKGLIQAPYLYNVSEQLNIYPPDSSNHKNLKKRWQYFLKTPATGLTAANDKLIYDEIYDALSDTKYENITFDAIEDTNNKLGQQVLRSPEHYDINVSGKKSHRMTKRIVLVTAPIPDPDGQNTPLDDQDNP